MFRNKIFPVWRASSAALIFVMSGSVCVAEAPTKRVHFSPGASSTVIKHSVLHGERDRYILGAKTGQILSLSISSSGRRAAFAVSKPGGGYLSQGSDENGPRKWQGKLPVSGDYLIQVSGTRGNAAYSLTVALK